METVFQIIVAITVMAFIGMWSSYENKFKAICIFIVIIIAEGLIYAKVTDKKYVYKDSDVIKALNSRTK